MYPFSVGRTINLVDLVMRSSGRDMGHSWMDVAAPGEGARLLRTAILAAKPDSSPEICNLLKRVDFFRLCPQLTRQVEIVMASLGVGCHFGSALVSERLFPKRFCPITHVRITL